MSDLDRSYLFVQKSAPFFNFFSPSYKGALRQSSSQRPEFSEDLREKKNEQSLIKNHLFCDPRAAPSETSIEKILSATESHDGKEVSVLGKVVNLKLKTSKRGNSYTTLTLLGTTGKGSLNVYSRGHVQVKEGQTVKVTGTYRTEKRVGKYTFHNEIEATSIKQE